MESHSGKLASELIALKKHAERVREYHVARRISSYLWAFTAVGAFLFTMSYPGYRMTGLRKYIDPDNTRDWRGFDDAREFWSILSIVLGFLFLSMSIAITSLSAGFGTVGFWILSGPVTLVAAIIWPTANVFSSDWGLFQIWAMLGSALYFLGTAKPPLESDFWSSHNE